MGLRIRKMVGARRMRRASAWGLVIGSLAFPLSRAGAMPGAADDSLGLRHSAVHQETRPETLGGAGPAAGAKILLFNSTCELCDAVADIESLGVTYVKTSNPDDLNLLNLRSFDIVWIGAGAGFANWSPRCGDIDAYVQGGGSLAIGQPNEVGVVPCLPPDLRTEVTDVYWPGNEQQMVNTAGACMVDGVSDAQLPGHDDTVPLALLGEGWSIVTVDRETPTEHAGMLYAQHGVGRVFFTDMCGGTGTPQERCGIPAAHAFLDKLIGCLRQHRERAVCDIQLNGTTFVTGDTVVARVLRIANPSTTEVPIELKIWFDALTSPPVSFVNIGAGGHLKLPPGFDNDVGPVALFTVTSACPRGEYAFSCRILHPVTGEVLGEDLNGFVIQ